MKKKLLSLYKWITTVEKLYSGELFLKRQRKAIGQELQKKCNSFPKLFFSYIPTQDYLEDK